MTKDTALRMIEKAELTGNLNDLVLACDACKEALEQPTRLEVIDAAILKFINEILDDNDSDSTWQSYAVQSAEMIRVIVENACKEALEQPTNQGAGAGANYNTPIEDIDSDIPFN